MCNSHNNIVVYNSYDYGGCVCVAQTYHIGRLPPHSQSATLTDLMLRQCWAIVCDAGPTLKPHWVSV